MARTLHLLVRLEIEGQPVEGYPLRRTLDVSALQSFDTTRAAGDAYHSLPVEALGRLRVLAIRPSQDIDVRLNGQTGAGATVKAGGLLLVFGGDLCRAPQENATVRNSSGGLARFRGIGAAV